MGSVHDNGRSTAPKGIWYLVEPSDDGRVRLRHGPGHNYADHVELLLSADAAAALGASLIAYAIELDGEAATAAVLQVLAPSL